MATTMTNVNTSRAALRTIEAGSSAMCASCDEQVKFKAKVKAQQVICNVYIDGRWDRVEHYHEECYGTAGKPYGEPAPSTGNGRVSRVVADANASKTSAA
jgi:hypothetical protein